MLYVKIWGYGFNRDPQMIKASAKRSQHANAVHRNFVGCNMLRAFGQTVAACWVLFAQI